MNLMVWAGAALTLCGVAGLARCIQLATRAKRAGLDQDGMRRALQRVVTLNLIALAVSAIGLMLVVAGVTLG
jgi:hypothetical protein